jgi:eukaryotic-like serine/threonine-protein kinase
MLTNAPIRGYRIGPFLLDLRSGELRHRGMRIRLQEKPRSVLIALAERPGEMITRKELQDRLWPNDTFVDFESGLNTAIRKLREALDDDVQIPQYIETIRGRGYRLLTPVEPLFASEPPPATHGEGTGAETVSPASADRTSQPPEEHPGPIGEDAFLPIGRSSRNGSNGSAPGAHSAATAPATLATPSPAESSVTSKRRSWLRPALWSFSGMLFLAVVGGCLWYTHARTALPLGPHDAVVIADFDNQTGDPRFDHALGTALTVSLEESHHVNIFPRLRVIGALRRMELEPETKITPEVASEICQRENVRGLVAPSITRAGNNYQLSAELIDAATGATVSSHSVSANGQEEILPALDQLVRDLRRDLGESLFQIQQSHRSLPEVTTHSLEALEQYADGSWLWNRAHYDEAMQHYQRAIALDPDFAMAHAALGFAYYSYLYNEPGLGEREFRKALELSPRTTERERVTIETRYAESQGRVDDALHLYQSFLAQWPGDSVARQSYARMLRMHGHAEEAVPLFKQVLDQTPDEPSTYIELATAYAALGRAQESIEAYQKAISLDSSILGEGNVDREYGMLLMRNGDDARAEQVFSALLADSKMYPQAQRSLAFFDLYHGRYASARRRLLIALPKSQTETGIADFRIHYMLAVIAAGEGKKKEQSALLDAMARRLNKVTEKVTYGSLLGQAYARAGEVKSAEKVLSAIAPLANGRSEEQVAFLQILKAEIAAARGDSGAALSLLSPPQPNDGSSATTLTEESLAHIYQQSGRIDEAMVWYNRFVNSRDLGPLGWEPQQRLFDSYYALATDYAQKGDRVDALSNLTALLSCWRNGDPKLPLRQEALLLRDRLIDDR